MLNYSYGEPRSARLPMLGCVPARPPPPTGAMAQKLFDILPRTGETGMDWPATRCLTNS